MQSQSNSSQNDAKRSPSSTSPYLQSLNDVQIRKRVRSATTFHAAAVSAQFLGAGRTMKSFLEEEEKNKTKQERDDDIGRKKQGKVGSWKKPPIQKKPIPAEEGDTKANDFKPNQQNHASSEDAILRKAEKSPSSIAEVKVKASGSEAGKKIRPISKQKVASESEIAAELMHAEGGEQTNKGEKGENAPNKEIVSEPASITQLKSLKSILKIPNVYPPRNSPRPRSAKVVKKKLRSPRLSHPELTVGADGKPEKKVSFYERVQVHAVPYESRGSTEWQHNLLLTRENMLRGFMAGPPLAFMSDSYLHRSPPNNWAIDNWFGASPRGRRRP